jgi:hypothetical protein
MSFENFQPELFDGSRPGTPDPRPGIPQYTPAHPVPGISNEQLMTLLVGLTQGFSRAVGRQIASARPKPPRFPDVERFSGDRSEAATFLLRLKVFFEGLADTYDTDAKRISYMFQRLDGAALRWARPIFEVDSANNLLLRSNMDCFLKEFKALFEDCYRKVRATKTLLKLQQGTRPVTEYWTEFVQLLAESSIDSISAREIFFEGLNDDLKRRLEDKEYSEDLSDFANQVCELEFRIQSNRQFAPLASPASRLSFPSPVSPGVAPMNIDVVHRGSREAAIRSLPKEEQRRICMAERRCFYCKVPSHVLRDCPAKTNKVSSASGASAYPSSVDFRLIVVILSHTAMGDSCHARRDPLGPWRPL